MTWDIYKISLIYGRGVATILGCRGSVTNALGCLSSSGRRCSMYNTLWRWPSGVLTTMLPLCVQTAFTPKCCRTLQKITCRAFVRNSRTEIDVPFNAGLALLMDDLVVTSAKCINMGRGWSLLTTPILWQTFNVVERDVIHAHPIMDRDANGFGKILLSLSETPKKRRSLRCCLASRPSTSLWQSLIGLQRSPNILIMSSPNVWNS